jgi:putative transposase
VQVAAVPVKAALRAYDGLAASSIWVYPNLVKGMTIEAPDVVWVADLTYIRLPSAFAYLAAILDAYSRKCVGWNLSKQIDTQLTVRAAMASSRAARTVKAGLIHHSYAWNL